MCDPVGEGECVYPLLLVKANVGRLCEKLKNALKSGLEQRCNSNFLAIFVEVILWFFTVMNCLAVADVCEQKGIPVRVQTAIEMRAVAEPYIRSRAIRHLEKGRVVIFGAGTGNPYFSTDTAAVLRAAEIDADVILLAKNVDGVYTADPVKDPTAVKYDVITYDDVLAQHLAVMDSTATSLSMDNHIPVLLFALKDPRNIIRALCGENVGTIVKE